MAGIRLAIRGWNSGIQQKTASDMHPYRLVCIIHTYMHRYTGSGLFTVFPVELGLRFLEEAILGTIGLARL